MKPQILQHRWDQSFSQKVFDLALVICLFFFLEKWIKLVRLSELIGKREKQNTSILVGELGVSRRDYPSMARTDLGMSEIYVLTMPAYVCNQQDMRGNTAELQCSKPKSYIFSQANCSQKQQMQKKKKHKRSTPAAPSPSPSLALMAQKSGPLLGCVAN